MKVTSHVKKRYVERIVGIKHKRNIKKYISKNNEKIEDEIVNMVKNYDSFQPWSNSGKRYIKGDITFVVYNDVVVTVYPPRKKCDFVR